MALNFDLEVTIVTNVCFLQAMLVGKGHVKCFVLLLGFDVHLLLQVVLFQMQIELKMQDNIN